MLSILKKLQILIFIFSFGALGVLYHYNAEDEWFVRYELKQSFTSKIYLRSIDERIKSLKVTDTTHKKFVDLWPFLSRKKAEILNITTKKK